MNFFDLSTNSLPLNYTLHVTFIFLFLFMFLFIGLGGAMDQQSFLLLKDWREFGQTVSTLARFTFTFTNYNSSWIQFYLFCCWVVVYVLWETWVVLYNVSVFCFFLFMFLFYKKKKTKIIIMVPLLVLEKEETRNEK